MIPANANKAAYYRRKSAEGDQSTCEAIRKHYEVDGTPEVFVIAVLIKIDEGMSITEAREAVESDVAGSLEEFDAQSSEMHAQATEYAQKIEIYCRSLEFQKSTRPRHTSNS